MLLVSYVAVYRPDRPIGAIPPGSSSGPAFAAQIIRPRLGLPLGGLLPPGLFGVEQHLRFDSASPGASIGAAGPRRYAFSADAWEVVLVVDDAGRVTPESYAVFELLFEGSKRRVRCRPATPVTGAVETRALGETGEWSGRFDVELAHCEDAATGKPLGWPPKPLVLHGSFDRLRPDAATRQR